MNSFKIILEPSPSKPTLITKEKTNSDVFEGDGSWVLTKDPIFDPSSPSPKTIMPINKSDFWLQLHQGFYVFIWSNVAMKWCYWGYGIKEMKRVFSQWGIVLFFDAEELSLILRKKPDEIIMTKILEVKNFMPARICSIEKTSKDTQ